MSVTAPDPTQQDFQPLYPTQDEETILLRMIGWANEGLDPAIDADQWVDTRQGSHWYTCNMPMIREIARIYDLMGTEVPMSGFVLWAWGTYLDDLAAVYQVERHAATPAQGLEQFSGPAGTTINAGVTISANPATPDDPAQDFVVTTGGTIPGDGSPILLPITAATAGVAGNVAADAITQPSTPLPAGVTFSNPNPTTDGTDPETDDSLRTRVLLATAGKGPGAVADYIRWAMAYAGVGAVKVVPLWDGPGTVLVMVIDPEGNPLSAATVTGLQNVLDPVSGQAHGVAPVGAIATVATSTLLELVIAATIIWETGYTWDGAGNSIAAGAAIMAAIDSYLLTIQPGGQIVYERVKGIVATAAGVHDVTALTINPGGTGAVSTNIAVALTPPQQPVLQTFNPS